MILLQAVADGNLSGGTTQVLQLVDAVRSCLPIEVRLLSQAGSPIIDEAARRGLRAHGLDFFRGRADPRLWLDLRRLIREVGPALIHAHGARAALPIVHLDPPAPCLYTVHGYHFTAKRGLARWAALAAERRIARRATMTVFVSPGDREIAVRERIRPRREVLIPNGVEVDDLPPARLGDGRTLAFLGRLQEQKDPLMLVEILARLRDRDFHLRIIGDGPLRQAVLDRASALGVADRLDLRGALPRAAALEALQDATVLLLPSRWEGLPLAMLEAMAMGVPVVASRIDGHSAVIEDGENGILVQARDAEGYARAVLALGADANWREQLIAAARQRVLRHFAWFSVRRRYLDLYREALDRA